MTLAARITIVTPVETWVWYDGPMFFSAQVMGRIRIFCSAGGGCGTEDIFLVSSPSEADIAAMEENRMTIRDAQLKGPHFLARGQVFAEMSFEELAPDTDLEPMLVKPDEFLEPEAESV